MRITLRRVAVSLPVPLVAAFVLMGAGKDLTSSAAANAAPAQPVERAAVDKIVGGWTPRPQLAAQQMLVKYGAPHEATSEQLIWHNQGSYKRIVVTRKEIPHDFPKPHMDYLEHTIHYHVPADKSNALVAFDGSVTLDRTAGEMSARCDLEGHNILTLNLAHDIVTGKKDVAAARKAFGQNVVDDSLGKNPPYVMALQFKPATSGVADADKPVIPGSPIRAAQAGSEASSDAEVLGFVVATNDNEILAAAEAAKKKVSPQVVQYAKMLHKEHGENLAQTMKLGQQMKVAPVETAAVDKLRVKGAGELAALMPLDGDQFASAYVAAMVKGHTEVLAMIDNELLKNAKNDALKKHLAETRSHIAMHLEEGKKLQSGLKR